MNIDVMHETMTQAQAGQLTFPEAVRRLTDVGVESYFVDLAARQETFYLSEGGTHTEPLTLPVDPIAAAFSRTGVRAAIRDAQTNTIRYPEFIKRSAAAGVIAYWAYLRGKKVIYFGREGDIHIEEFPRPRSG